MNRRDILGLMAGAALRPLASQAQQPARVPLVGILSDETPSLGTSFGVGVAQGLLDLRYVEGQNIAFERRYAEGKQEILPSLAAELVLLQPDVILAIGTNSARAAKSATQTIPIVFVRTADPIGSGLVTALARPGGNLTGLSDQMVETGAKRLELLTTAVPDVKRVGVLWNSDYPTNRSELKEIEQAARSLRLRLIPADVRGPIEFDPAFRTLMEQHAGAAIVMAGTIFAEHSQRLADMTAKARLPAISFSRRFVELGGLMSYATDAADTFRRTAAYLDRILKGAKPTDLPVQQPTKFELVINLKTAKALGLTVPPSLLARADEVIE